MEPPVVRLYLKEWREHRGLTQQQLSERSGIALQNISQFETGVRTWNVEHLEQLSLALDIDDPRKLLFGPA
jgi:transcriptional regulator with XRE-family HTH domain